MKVPENPRKVRCDLDAKECDSAPLEEDWLNPTARSMLSASHPRPCVAITQRAGRSISCFGAGHEINGIDVGTDGGRFGYINNYLSYGSPALRATHPAR